MRGKLLLLVGLGIGYVLGARAGRARYEQIKRAAKRVWEDPRVQSQVKNVEDFAKDKAPDVVDFISDNAKKLVGRGSEPSASASSAAKTAAPKTARKTAAPKKRTTTAAKPASKSGSTPAASK